MNSKRWTLVAAILGSAIVFLDSTVVGVALPRIGIELKSSLLGVLEAQAYVIFTPAMHRTGATCSITSMRTYTSTIRYARHSAERLA